MVVSDNAPNMIKMGKLIDMTHSRCQAHIGNLLLKDLGKQLKTDDVLEKILPVLKEFTKSKFAAYLKEKIGNAAKIPIEVRWCSNRDSIQNYVHNLSVMKKVAIDHNMDSKFIKILIDENILKECNDALRILDPVCKMLNIFQKKKTRLGEAVEMWLSYIEDAGEFEKPTILKRVKKTIFWVQWDSVLWA